VLPQDIPDIFLDWNAAQKAGFKTKAVWKYDYGRMVIGKPMAYYQEIKKMSPREYRDQIDEQRSRLRDNPEMLFHFEARIRHQRFGLIANDRIEVVINEIPLYHESQTREGNFRDRTKAIIEYAKVFWRSSRTEEFLEWNFDQDKYPGAKWFTRNPENHNCAIGPFRYFGERQMLEHLNQKNKIYGVKANPSKLQWWCAVDLDLHIKKGGVPEIFMKQVEAVLTHLHGDGWIICLNRDVVDGIHVLKIFDKPVLLSDAKHYARSMLIEVADRFPEVAHLGEKPLVESEIFPSSTRGFRLPLGIGYTALVDKPLDLVQYHAYQGVPQHGADVTSFMNWNRIEMPLAEKLNFIRSRLPEPSDTPYVLRKPKSQTQQDKATKEVARELGDTKLLGTMKGRYRKVLVDFFSGNMQVPGSLQTGILLGAKALWAQGYPYEDQAEYLLNLLMRIKVTDPAFSTRMANEDWDAILYDIEHTVDGVERSLSNPNEPKLKNSVRILRNWAASMDKAGFVFGDLSTWKTCWNGSESKPWFNASLLTDEDRAVIAERIAPIMNCTPETAIEIVVKMVQLASIKDRHGDGMSREYRRAVLLDEGIACQENSKLARCWGVVEQYGFIYKKQDHFFSKDRKGRARAYAAGRRVVERIQREKLEKVLMPDWLKDVQDEYFENRWSDQVLTGGLPTNPLSST